MPVCASCADQHVLLQCAGKFVLLVEEDEQLEKRLVIRVERARGPSPEVQLESLISDCVTRELLRLNSEYRHYVPAEKQAVHVRIHEFGDVKWFPVGVKHKYTLE